jgi:hypothetical protein
LTYVKINIGLGVQDVNSQRKQGGPQVLNLEQIRAGLADRKLKVVAQETGLNYMTVWRISSGNQKNPKFATVAQLSEYLSRKVGV